MKIKTIILAAGVALAATASSQAVVIISEIDADQTGTDTGEFVELFSTTATTTALDGLSVVFFNGSSDTAYSVFDLDGFSTDSDGYFVIGNTGVASVDIVISSNGLQNGADAVALYTGDFSSGDAVTTTSLLQAIVYDTNDGDDSGLLTGLGETVQYNEDEGGDKDIESLVFDAGSGTWSNAAPTPGFAIPEPSTAILGAFGALALLRRRR